MNMQTLMTVWVALIWAAVIVNAIWRVFVAVKNRGKDMDKAATTPERASTDMSIATHMPPTDTFRTITFLH